MQLSWPRWSLRLRGFLGFGSMPELFSDTIRVEHLLASLKAGSGSARTQLIEHACDRLRLLSSQMLRRFPRVHRWEETDDVFVEALGKLHRSLAAVQPESARHFYNLAAAQIRRVLLDLARKHLGPGGHAAHHESVARAGLHEASQPDMLCEAADPQEPADLEEWTEFHAKVETLPADEKEIFALLWYDGLTQEAAAKLLDVSERTVKRRWQMAKFLLSRTVQDE